MFQTKDLRQIRARFWQDKLSRIKTDDDVRRFVGIYLPLFAKDLADLCLDALSHLSQVDSDSAHRVADWVASDQDGLGLMVRYGRVTSSFFSLAGR